MLNVFEAVDVIALIKGGVYDDLNLTVGDALLKRSDVSLLLASANLLFVAHILAGLPWHLHMLTGRQHVDDIRYNPQITCSPIYRDRL